MADTVHILIPNALRPQTGQKESVQVAGQTVAQALGALCTQYPELGKRLFKADQELNRFVNVYVNNEDIRFLENLQTPLQNGDEIAIVPAIAGG